MSVQRGGDAGARVAQRRRAIITASRVAARRRHLAGCQTRWGPPSRSSQRNKGSVTNTDSCNISPGPRQPFHQPKRTQRNISLAIYMNMFGRFIAVVTAVACVGRKFGSSFPYFCLFFQGFMPSSGGCFPFWLTAATAR